MTHSDARFLRAMAIAAEADDAEELTAGRRAHALAAAEAAEMRQQRNSAIACAVILAAGLLVAVFGLGGRW